MKSLTIFDLRSLSKDYLRDRIKPKLNTFESMTEFPSHFEIETINACNARCPMCTIDEWDKDEKVMKDELFKKIADELALNKKYLKRVNLYRDGEPLLDRKLPARISMLKSLGIPNVSISTNASLLDENKAREILSAQIDMVTVSVDSLKKEVYEAIRRGLVFEEVLNNVKRFIQIRNEMNSSCEIWVRMIRQNSNIDEFPSYLKYWEGLEILNNKIDRIYYHNIFDWGGQLFDYDRISTNSEQHLPCVSLWSLMPIFANGDVPMCNVDFNCNHKIGNVFETSIKEIWQSQNIMNIRENHLDGKKFCYKMCENCNVWEEVPQRDGTPTVTSQYVRLLQTSNIAS